MIYEVMIFDYLVDDRSIRNVVSENLFLNKQSSSIFFENTYQEQMEFNYLNRDTNNRRGVICRTYQSSSSFLVQKEKNTFYCEVDLD